MSPARPPGLGSAADRGIPARGRPPGRAPNPPRRARLRRRASAHALAAPAPILIPLELRTERLLLRQWRPDDVEPLTEIYRQPGYLEHMRAHDVEGTRAQIEKFERQWAEDGLSHWAVEDLESGRLIGRIGLLRHHDWPLEPSPVEVGWVLDERYWGRGLATEGGRASLEVWRNRLPADQRLISITSPANTRCRHPRAEVAAHDGGRARRDAGDAALDRLGGAHPCGPRPPEPHRAGATGPLRACPPGRTRPRRRQTAGPDRGRRRQARLRQPVPGQAQPPPHRSRGRPPLRRRLRVRARRRRRPQPARLRRGLA